jgi:hypothetical protein
MIGIIRKLATAAGTLAVAITMSVTAQAAPIGHTSFGVAGGFQITSGTDLGNTNSFMITNSGAVVVTAADPYDLAALIQVGGTGTLQGIPNLSAFTPIANFLQLATGVAIDLNTLMIDSRSGGPPGFLNLKGQGFLRAPGFDATPGIFSWTGTTTDNLTFSFAVEASNNVPEPVSIALLGLGLAGIALMNRKRLGAASI